MRKYIPAFILILVASLIVLYPSFRLGFDGDSYLTLWRYQFYQRISTGNILLHNIKYFFTDYGPQDTFFAFIHKVFGLNPLPFYIISFVLRLIASLSFFPLVYALTKNKTAAFVSSLFFSITSTGLETTNWVFNMPSYTAILFLNIYLLLTVKFLLSKRVRYFILSLIFFVATIVFQPIRMIFLPFYVILLEFFIYLQNRNMGNFVKLVIKSTIILIIVSGVLLTTNIGNSVGLNINTSNSNKNLNSSFSNFFSTLNTSFVKRDARLIYYPLAQIGNIVFPSDLLTARFEILNTPTRLAIISIFLNLSFLFILSALKKQLRFSSKTVISFLFASLIWTTFFIIFEYNHKDYFTFNNFISEQVGFYFSLSVLLLYLTRKKIENIKLGIFLSSLLIIFSFIIPWLRNPTSIIETTSRYLIVPAAGLAILLGVILGSFKKIPKIIKVFVFVVLITSGLSSIKYLGHLAQVRGVDITERIRNSFPVLTSLNQGKEPVLFYFETNNQELLHHSIMFGFPVMIYYKQPVANAWNIAYTQDWNEVQSAYLTGEGLRRFGTIPIMPVKINNIYSFFLKGGLLLDTTKSTREKLISIKK